MAKAKKIKAQGFLKKQDNETWSAHVWTIGTRVIISGAKRMKDAQADGNRIAELLGWEVEKWEKI